METAERARERRKAARVAKEAAAIAEAGDAAQLLSLLRHTGHRWDDSASSGTSTTESEDDMLKDDVSVVSDEVEPANALARLAECEAGRY